VCELRLFALDHEHPVDVVGQGVLGLARNLPQARGDQLRFVAMLRETFAGRILLPSLYALPSRCSATVP
jgi:hypothetical protein